MMRGVARAASASPDGSALLAFYLGNSFHALAFCFCSFAYFAYFAVTLGPTGFLLRAALQFCPVQF